MIDVRELRFGNYYFYITGEIIKVDKKHFNYIDKFCKFANPIELTPAILERWCGFENLGNIFEIDGWHGISVMQCYLNGITFYHLITSPENVVISKDFDYLHQLQNIYFALTGEELKINYESKRNTIYKI